MSKAAVITRTKDRPLLLRRAAASLMSQVFTDFTWVVVNDGGDPQTLEETLAEAASVLRDRLHIIHHPQSRGMEAASNTGIYASDSEFLAIHDDDDTWSPLFLRQTVETLENKPHPLVKGVVTYCMRISEVIENHLITEIDRKSYNGDLRNIKISHYLKKNISPPICFLYERKVHNTIGYYAEDMDVLGDWDFFLRYHQNFEAVLLRQYLANYHVRPNISAGAYGNSITAGLDKHAFFDQLMWNRLLREDLAAGRSGIGVLATIDQSVREVLRQFDLPLALLLPLQEARRDGVTRMAICGSGEAGRKAAYLARAMNLSIHCMTDKNPAQHNTLWEGIPILPLRDAVHAGLPCFVGSIEFAQEIAAEITDIAIAAHCAVPPIYRPTPFL